MRGGQRQLNQRQRHRRSQRLSDGSRSNLPVSHLFEVVRRVRQAVSAGDDQLPVGRQRRYGIQQIIAQTVDFGASDAAMSDADLAKAPAELLHIPTVAGAVVVTYNIEGVQTGLKLTPENLAGIFLGKITKWNDPALKADNPGVNFPDKDIVTVHRSDGSGTTNIFTSYLDAVSPEWHDKAGKGKGSQVAGWPGRQGERGRQRPGVTDQGLHRLCGTGLCQAEQDVLCLDEKQGGQLR